MPEMTIQTVTEEEVAAALAAIQLYLTQEQAPDGDVVVTSRSVWRDAAVIEAQGLPFTRNGADVTWGTTERVHRARRWSKGIVGS